MENKFKKIYLNEKAISFISEKLQLFGSIGLRISNLISSSKHKIWGLYSSRISDDDLIEFEFGGKLEDRPIHEVVEIVKLSLKKNDDRCWILIDNNGNVKYSPEKNAIENITTVFFYNDL